jgi:hypothetical protein
MFGNGFLLLAFQSADFFSAMETSLRLKIEFLATSRWIGKALTSVGHKTGRY